MVQGACQVEGWNDYEMRNDWGLSLEFRILPGKYREIPHAKGIGYNQVAARNKGKYYSNLSRLRQSEMRNFRASHPPAA
jgi:hypothetical protein